MKTSLILDWASYEAAKYACKYWHYSKSVPAGKMVRVGVWENGEFIGVVLFGRGANNNLAKSLGVDTTEVAELTRIALKTHSAPVSQIISIAVGMLRKQSPGLRVLVSYADPMQGHTGVVYQAANWVYVGLAAGADEYMVNGKRTHGRSVNAKYGTVVGFRRLKTEKKYKYILPLDKPMRKQIELLRKPFPMRPKQATGEDHSYSGAAAATRTLHQ